MTSSTPHNARPKFLTPRGCASLAGLLLLCPLAPVAARQAPDSVTAEATRAMGQGRPYRAFRLLLPVTAKPDSGEPEIVLLAARAAAAWEGWGSVVRLLAGRSWLDRMEGGEGRALLARARVERGEDAVEDSRAALRAGAGEAIGPRLVILARAFDRAGQLDSAAATYRAAAARFPAIGDWLRLRAAGVTADSLERSGLYREVTLDVATTRVRPTEALARERAGDRLGAARIYEAMGSALDALRLRLDAASDSATRAEIRSQVLTYLERPLTPGDARSVVTLVDRLIPTPTAAQELQIGRRAASADLLSRAALGFSRAGKLLTQQDLMTYGGVLARLNRHREAMAVYGAVKAPALVTQARYQRARSLMRTGTRGSAIAALRRVARGLVTDSATAATAGYLAADLLVDEGDEIAARTGYLEVARRFPTTPFGSRAAMVAAMIAYGGGEYRDAVRELNALVTRPGDRSEIAAALYWAGRSYKAAGDTGNAAQKWRLVLERFPQSYYALPARDRLGITTDPVAATVPPNPASDDVLHAVERAGLLERLGLKVEARFELDRVTRDAEAAPATIPAVAFALTAGSYTARAYRLALRSTDPSLDRTQFPVPRRADLFDEARLAGVDPLLAAALIRQESAFDPAARSAADARGLMQVVPSVGAALARADGLKDWDASLLFQAELNVHFGLSHLAAMLKRSPHLAHALAAYNAGTRPADEWAALPGGRTDPELYIERIQYAETRDYVRRVLRNLAMYRALYPQTP